ncbi:FaeA/PapI family transcriptional regulator [Citrobacter sp. Cb003]|uniref:FaeA/PapI family transcriptional regulator n=1 Tax=Citrobacter sp. Cb003 TaxID=2985005 RepID=UPI00257EEEEB|nr:FaeA/PapI family transcriptional regulator [Citrobacter sp. Cb003]MDM3379276.1 FaeA/PapI family transcriptional regulator [Citrobacter sp. Cb003]
MMSTPRLKKTTSLLNVTAYGKKRESIANDIINNLIEAGEHGLTTREVANYCSLSIYSARYNLLILKKKGYVIKENVLHRNGGKWFIVDT